MRYRIIMLVVITLLSSCMSSTDTENLIAAPGVTHPATQTYTASTAGLTYTVTVPATWMLVDENAAGLRFQAVTAAETPTIRWEDQSYIGGITIRSRCAPEQTTDLMYTCILPNHSTVRSFNAVSTPAGVGRVYTLEHSYPVGDQRRWWAQHAFIPIDRYMFDVWVQVEPQTTGPPVTILEEMLRNFRVTLSDTSTG